MLGMSQIEPDASSASYFHAVNAMFPEHSPVHVMACQPPRCQGGTGWQIDAEFPRLAPRSMGYTEDDRAAKKAKTDATSKVRIHV